jgi:hypothetical protein
MFIQRRDWKWCSLLHPLAHLVRLSHMMPMSDACGASRASRSFFSPPYLRLCSGTQCSHSPSCLQTRTIFTNTHYIYRYSTSFNRTNLSYAVVKSGKKKDTLKSMAERIKTRYKGESGEFRLLACLLASQTPPFVKRHFFRSIIPLCDFLRPLLTSDQISCPFPFPRTVRFVCVDISRYRLLFLAVRV